MANFSLGEKLGLRFGSVSKRAIFSYIFDYAIILIFLFAFLSIDKLEPFHQQFSLRNYTLQYKHVENQRVSNFLLFCLACIAPLVIIVFYTLIIDGLFSHGSSGWRRKYTLKERLWELNCGLLGLGLSVSMTYTITGSLKNAIGKPRPDLIDRCRPTIFEDPTPFGLSNITICNQPNHTLLKDGFRSFPSGHSSISFSGLFYLSLYLAAKMHILDSRGEAWKFFVVLAPSLGAALIAGSRIMDARHHPFDVISGSALGAFFAWAAYRQYFPQISNFRAKGRAYPMRTWARDHVRPTGGDSDFDYQPRVVGDEEQQQDVVLSTGNHFRDVLNESQRLRQASVKHNVQSGSIQSPVSVLQSSNLPGPQRSGGREEIDEMLKLSNNEYELQHQYSLNRPERSSYYDSYDSAFSQQNTAYNPSVPSMRLPSMRSPAGDRVSPVSAENSKRRSVPGELLEGRNKE